MSDIEHQDYYNKGEIECFDVINEMVIGYTVQEAVAVGNVVKYLYRAPYKGFKEKDIAKAMMWLKRLQNGSKNVSNKVIDSWDREEIWQAWKQRN